MKAHAVELGSNTHIVNESKSRADRFRAIRRAHDWRRSARGERPPWSRWRRRPACGRCCPVH
eukprot:7382488-Prymnesium_polylepis.2